MLASQSLLDKRIHVSENINIEFPSLDPFSLSYFLRRELHCAYQYLCKSYLHGGQYHSVWTAKGMGVVQIVNTARADC